MACHAIAQPPTLPATEALPEACALNIGFCAGVAAVALLLLEAAGVVAEEAAGLAWPVDGAAVAVAGGALLVIELPVAASDDGFASAPCTLPVEVRLCEPAVAVPVAVPDRLAELPEARVLA